MNTNRTLKLLTGLLCFALFLSCAPKNDSDFQNLYVEQSNIIGGSEATLEYAQQNGIVGLYDLVKGGLCTGSVIAEGLVITAGHCVNVENLQKMIIFFGKNLDEIATQINQQDFANVRPVAKIIRHESYIKSTEETKFSKNDIALVRFQGRLPAGFNLAKIASSKLVQALVPGSVVSLAGYGLSEFKGDPQGGSPLIKKGSGVLRKVLDVKVMSILASGEEVTLDQSQGRGACHGDSGGPAYYQDTQSANSYVIGITSRGSGDCDEEAIYTLVSGYTQWIDLTAKKLMQ